ncbi:hypothetical protein ACRAWD_28295 [Caulobacter segnis]
MIDTLPRREREVFETLCRLEAGTTAEVRAALSDPPQRLGRAHHALAPGGQGPDRADQRSRGRPLPPRPGNRDRRGRGPATGDRHLLRRLGRQRRQRSPGHGPEADAGRSRRPRGDDRQGRRGRSREGGQGMTWTLLFSLLVKSSIVAGGAWPAPAS